METSRPNPYKEQARLLQEYCDANLALNALEKTLLAEVVPTEAARAAIAAENSTEKPNLKRLITSLIKQEGSVPWSDETPPKKRVSANIGGIQYQAIIEKPKTSDEKKASGPEYLVTITDEVKLQDGKIASVPLHLPTFTVRENKERTFDFSVSLGSKLVISEKGPRVNEIQRNTISKYAESMRNGEPASLALMGTASGKSWVIAGVTHALGGGVYIVPNKALADEMQKDAIKALQGQGTEVTRPKPNSTPEELKAALTSGKHVILTADAPYFQHIQDEVKKYQEESNKITDERMGPLLNSLQQKFVLIDESHEHTFKESNLATLRAIRHNGPVLALTGSPTGALYESFPPPIVDVNVRQVMDAGAVRQMHGTTQFDIKAESVERQALLGHLGTDVYLTESASYKWKGPQDFIKEYKEKNQDLTEEQAITKAIEYNRERALNEKGFIFSLDNEIRNQFVNDYALLHEGKHPDQRQIEQQVAEMRRESELNARVNMYLILHPTTEDYDTVKNRIRTELPPVTPVDLKSELQHAQKQQIANSVNTEVISRLFGIKPKDAEAHLAKGTLQNFIKDVVDSYTKGVKEGDPGLQEKMRALGAMTRGDIEKMLQIKEKRDEDGNTLKEGSMVNLPPEQRSQWVSMVIETSMNLIAQVNTSLKTYEGSLKAAAPKVPDISQWIGKLRSPDSINLAELHASNTVNVHQTIDDLSEPEREALLGSNTPIQKMKESIQAEQDAVLDQLRSGLVMQVATGRTFSTGISITSVLSVQDLITSNADTDMVYQIQLLGRDIRTNYRGAINQQYVSEAVDPRRVPTIEAIVLDPHSGVRIKEIIDIQKDLDRAVKQQKDKTEMTTAVTAAVGGPGLFRTPSAAAVRTAPAVRPAETTENKAPGLERKGKN